MKKLRFILINLFVIFFFNVLFVKSAEQKTASESRTRKSYPIPLEIIKKGDIQAAQKALDDGADVNAKYKTGINKKDSALNAANLSNIEMIEFLLKSKADPNVKTPYIQRTLLMKAAEYGHSEIVRILIENKANINDQDYRGNTALICASQPLIIVGNSCEIVRMLLEAGADVKIANEDGKTFLSIINNPITYTEFDKEDMKRILKTYNEFVLKKLINDVDNNDFEIIYKTLQEYPELINTENEIGETILSEAILFGRFSIIKELFENPNIEIKPSLLEGQITKGLYNVKNSVEYAIKLGRPGCDPKKQIYRDIAVYLKKQRDLQEGLRTKTKEK